MPISVRIDESKDTTRLLLRMPVAMREKVVKKAIKAAAQAVAKRARQLAPKPGYVGDDPTKPALNKSIRVVVRMYGNVIVAVVGPVGRLAPHAHLVEFGHRKVLWGRETGGQVAGKPFLRPCGRRDTSTAESGNYRYASQGVGQACLTSEQRSARTYWTMQLLPRQWVHVCIRMHCRSKQYCQRLHTK